MGDHLEGLWDTVEDELIQNLARMCSVGGSWWWLCGGSEAMLRPYWRP